MNVNQLLNVIHPFTHVFIETVSGKLIELKLIDPEDLEQLKRKKVLKVTPTDYLEIKILVGTIKSARTR